MYLLKQAVANESGDAVIALHSIMYLLKRRKTVDTFFLLSVFTFHYVSIKTDTVPGGRTDVIDFTFHYVSIKTPLNASTSITATYLYIPLYIY